MNRELKSLVLLCRRSITDVTRPLFENHGEPDSLHPAPESSVPSGWTNRQGVGSPPWSTSGQPDGWRSPEAGVFEGIIWGRFLTVPYDQRGSFRWTLVTPSRFWTTMVPLCTKVTPLWSIWCQSTARTIVCTPRISPSSRRSTQRCSSSREFCSLACERLRWVTLWMQNYSI